MTRTALLPWPVFKEIRALLFLWLACAAALIVPAVVDTARLFGGVSVFAYFLGAAALGALSMGQEYTDHTLSLLLSVPMRRERLLLNKLCVLAAMLVTLGVVAYTLAFADMDESQPEKLAASVLPVLYGLCVAPWLTMACRSSMAGMVFTLTVPVLLLLAGWLIGATQYGCVRDELDAFGLAFLWCGTLGLCAIGAVVNWRMFMRLEAIDGRGADLHLPQWLRRRTTRNSVAQPLTTRHPIWLLVTKELRLQQMTLVVAGLYVLGWLAAVWLQPLVPHIEPGFEVLTIFYAGLLALLSGSFASAEERQLGTLDWQVLLPMATSKQWAVKIGVVLGLTMVLALGLPVVFASLSPVMDATPLVQPGFASVVLLLTAGSLYVSSCCTSGVWALVMSLPAILGASWFLAVALNPVATASYKATWRLLVPWERSGVDLRVVWRWFAAWERSGVDLRVVSWRVTEALDLVLVVGFVAIVLRFALANHRSADRSRWRLAKQVMLMAGFATGGVMIQGVLRAFAWWPFMRG